MWEDSFPGFHTAHDVGLLFPAAATDALLPCSSLPYPLPPPMMSPSHPPPFDAAGLYAAERGALAFDGVAGTFGLAPMDQTGPVLSDRAAAGKGLASMTSLFGSLHAGFGRMTSARETMDAKALAASKSHSEAERRRRQRINGHLARLRSLLPNTTKTDKASLLAEVIEHVKELKRQTSAVVADESVLPTEADELAVDVVASDEDGRLVVRASLCCEDRSDLIPDLVKALRALKLCTRKAEITTLGGRIRTVLLVSGEEDDDFGPGQHHECVASIEEALRSVVERKQQAAPSSDTSSSGSGKRQRMNHDHAQALAAGSI